MAEGILSRRGFLAGLIAAPAILKLGIHMPIKPELEVIEPEVIGFEVWATHPEWQAGNIVTLRVPDQFASLRLAMAEAHRLTTAETARAEILLAPGEYRLTDLPDLIPHSVMLRGESAIECAARSQSTSAGSPGPNRKARRRAMALA